MTTRQKQASFAGTIESLLAELGEEEKVAEAKSEPGGYQGGTTHPVANVDDRLDDAQEGARSSENTEDVKTEPNRGQTVDETTPGPGGGQESVQMDVGITSKATGDDSSAETDSAKDGKQDGGTHRGGSAHPARTDNEQLDGHKYSSDLEALRALCKQAEDLGSAICASIAVGTEKGAEGAGKADPKGAGNTNSQAGGCGVKDGPITEDGKVNARDESGGNAAKQSADAGDELAARFAGLDLSAEDKVATDNMVVETLQEVVETAWRRAEKCAEFYAEHFKAENPSDFPKGSTSKVAMPEGEGDAGAAEEKDDSDESKSESEGGEGGGPPVEGGDASIPAEGGGGGEEEALLSMLEGGEGMGAEDAAGGMGLGGGEPPVDPMAGGGDAAGADPLAAMGGGDPMAALGGGDPAAAGGDPMAALGGGPEMGGDPAAMGGAPGLGGEVGGDMGGLGGGGDELAQLEAILQELGITPEELEMAIAGKQASLLRQKQAAAKQAAGKKAHDAKYAAMKAMVQELVGRSR